MNSRPYKKPLAFLILAIFSSSLSLFWFGAAKGVVGGLALRSFGEGNLEVAFLDVGQGDSILIKAPAGQNILIDGGPDKAVLRRLGEVLPWWDRRLDLVILTHPHDDHLTGLEEVAERYQIRRVLQAGVADSNPNYQSWLKLIAGKKLLLTLVDKPQVIELGNGCRLEILYPRSSLRDIKPQNLNNSSVIAKLVYGEDKVLLMGDAEQELEAELLASGIDLSADILKVGHHGSDTASTEKFLQAVGAKTAIIEVGKTNDFGHPSSRTLKKLERAGVKIFRTDQDGTIIFRSRGGGFERLD